MGPQFALRMLPDGDSCGLVTESFNGAAVCTADVTVLARLMVNPVTASMGPQFALRMLLWMEVYGQSGVELQWGRSLHCGCYFSGSGLRSDTIASMGPQFALRMLQHFKVHIPR